MSTNTLMSSQSATEVSYRFENMNPRIADLMTWDYGQESGSTQILGMKGEFTALVFSILGCYLIRDGATIRMYLMIDVDHTFQLM